MKFKVTGLILSAGKSGRIGEPKAFIKFNDKTFIAEIISKLEKICDKIVIVFGYDASKMINNLFADKNLSNYKDRLIVAVNQNFEYGMFSSLQCGLSRVNNCDFVLVHQIDQPSLPIEFYLDFSNQLEEGIDWLQPAYDGKIGHPIFINRKLVEKILQEDINSNLREFKRKNIFNQKIWNCNYSQIHQDIDTKDDYEKLIRGA
ncbi:MAG: NTP transferase domain-containing protein [Ignavibacteria bacterium]|nr:NTP transferase domain-containing protein [Ignavibacteria bacterium]